MIMREPGHGHQHSEGHHQLTGGCHDVSLMSQSIARMAPLWKWSEDVQPRSGKDEALSEDRDHSSVGRKKFVPFNRLDYKKESSKKEQIHFSRVSLRKHIFNLFCF